MLKMKYTAIIEHIHLTHASTENRCKIVNDDYLKYEKLVNNDFENFVSFIFLLLLA